MARKIFALVILMLCVNSCFAAQNLQDDYDIIIAGAGTGGMAAAIQASRMGVNVLVVESSQYVGGQAVASGVSTMDDMCTESSGLYLEFINRVEEYYAARGKSIATSDWRDNSIAFEPHVGHKILMQMAMGEDAPDILFGSEVVGVDSEKIITANANGVKEAKRINSVIIKTPEGRRNITCRILIEATEYGDILPLVGTEYRVGNSLSSKINPNSMIQDITWPAVIRKYPEGIPEHLRPKNSLPEYDRAKWNYEKYVTKNGHDFKGVFPVEMPVNFVSHNVYRGLPDSFLPGNYDASIENWPLITKTGVNWGNDYPGQYRWRNKYGLPIAYLEDKTLRARIERDALIKTLHFIYYMQNELGESWSIDENEYNELPEAAKDLPEEWQNIARHMPPRPYVRESRRIIGEHVLISQELFENSLSYKDGNKNNEFADAIAIGGYNLDLHHADTSENMENDLGEKAEYIEAHSPRGNFQVPMDILIPKDVEGLIAAEKNLSMSRLSAGALRLQPITMMTGQAAGALAATAILQDKQPSQVKAFHVQKALLDSSVNLSLCKYSDVPETSKYYKPVQLATLYKLIEPREYPSMRAYGVKHYLNNMDLLQLMSGNKEKGQFGIDEKINDVEIQSLNERLGNIVGNLKLSLPLTTEMTRGEAVDVAVKAMLSVK